MLYGAPQWEILQLVSFLLNCVYILHHNDQVNVAFASSSIARKTMVEMLYVAPCSINGFFLAQFIFYFLPSFSLD